MAEDDDGGKSTSVRVPLTEDTAERWTEAAEELNRPKTGMIREAVELYLDDEWILESEAGNDVPEEVTERLERIETQLDNLALDTTSDGAEAPPDMSRDELIGLADTARERIPVVADAQDFAGQLSTGMINRPCHVDHLADVLDADVDRVERALIYAREHMDVDSTQIGSDRGWFRVIPDSDTSSSVSASGSGEEGEPETPPKETDEPGTDDSNDGDDEEGEPENPADLFEDL